MASRECSGGRAAVNGVDVHPEFQHVPPGGTRCQRHGFVLGEERESSCGNIYRLEEFDGKDRCGVRRIGIVGRDIEPTDLWDNDTVYQWTRWQWESLPLVGERSDDPSFGLFLGQKPKKGGDA